jgi:hypothetical protein
MSPDAMSDSVLKRVQYHKGGEEIHNTGEDKTAIGGITSTERHR